MHWKKKSGLGGLNYQIQKADHSSSPSCLITVTIQTHVELVDADTLGAVSVQPADRAGQLAAIVVHFVAHRALEDRVTRRGLYDHCIIRQHRAVRLIQPHLRVLDRLQIQGRAHWIPAQHIVQLFDEKRHAVLQAGIVPRDRVTGVAHAPVIGDVREVAGAIVRHRQEPTDATRDGGCGLSLDAPLEKRAAQILRLQQIRQRFVKVEGRREAVAVPPQVPPGEREPLAPPPRQRDEDEG